MAVDQAQEWLQDPAGRHQFRLYSDGRPTAWVSDGQAITEDPLVPAPEHSSPGGTASNSLQPAASPAPGGTVTNPSVRPVGWYRNASNPDEVRYWDGTQWATGQAAASSPNPYSRGSGGTDGAGPEAPGRHSIGRISSGDPTSASAAGNGHADVGPVPAQVRSDTPDAADGPPPSAIPAEWYPDPSDRTRLRFWDGAGWTAQVLDEAPAFRPSPAGPPAGSVNGAEVPS